MTDGGGLITTVVLWGAPRFLLPRLPHRLVEFGVKDYWFLRFAGARKLGLHPCGVTRHGFQCRSKKWQIRISHTPQRLEFVAVLLVDAIRLRAKVR